MPITGGRKECIARVPQGSKCLYVHSQSSAVFTENIGHSFASNYYVYTSEHFFWLNYSRVRTINATADRCAVLNRENLLHGDHGVPYSLQSIERGRSAPCIRQFRSAQVGAGRLP